VRVVDSVEGSEGGNGFGKIEIDIYSWISICKRVYEEMFHEFYICVL
jgi:hypothetical protein